MKKNIVFTLFFFITVVSSTISAQTSVVYTTPNNSIAGYNAILGRLAGNSQTGVSGIIDAQNTYIGDQAGYLAHSSVNYENIGNVAVGSSAGYNLTTGSSNSFLGNYAGQYNKTADYNVFIGARSGAGTSASYVAGGANTGIGSYSLQNITTGQNNQAIGFSALGYGSISGSDNIAMGAFAGGYLSSASNNILIGKNAGYGTSLLNLTGNANIAIGQESGFKLNTATNNILIGYQSGYGITTSSNNLFIGYQSGFSQYNVTNAYNSFIGYQSGFSNTTGVNNTYLGYSAGKSNTTMSDNTIIGSNAGDGVFTAGYNTIMGSNAGTNSTGGGNTFLGAYTARDNTTGTDNNMFGAYAGYLQKASGNVIIGSSAGYGFGTTVATVFSGNNVIIGNEAGYKNYEGNNAMVGYRAGYNNTSGTANTYFGAYAGYTNATNWSNTMVGYSAGQNTNAADNTILGARAGYNNAAGTGNVIIGDDAGYNSKSSKNVLIGTDAGLGSNANSNSTQSENTLIGYQAGTVQYGTDNTMLGSSAGVATTAGYSNIFIGKSAGYTTTTGYGNVFLGNFARAEGTNKTTLNNATAIGWAALAIRNRTMILGDTTVNIQVGIGTAWPTQKLTVKGNFAFVAYNDGMFYKNKRFLFQDEKENIALGTNHEEDFKGSGNLLLGVGAKVNGERFTVNGQKINNSTAIGYGATVSVSNGLVLGNENVYVGIGTSAPTARLEVASGKEGESGMVFSNMKQNSVNKFLTVNNLGQVILQKPRTQISSTEEWSDKVFESYYQLKSLNEVEDFVKANKHLPNIPSAQEMTEQGIESDKLASKLLEKIEELTLYLIEMKKENQELKSRVLKLEKN